MCRMIFLQNTFNLKAKKTQKMGIKFIAEKISKTATIHLDGDVNNVFPLFGAFEERKWAEGFDPELIYPAIEVIEEGTIFKTGGRGLGESEFIWRVLVFEAEIHLIQYLVYTVNRQWTITINCTPLSKNKTEAKVTYTFTGLNEKGNEHNKQMLEIMFQHNLKDWEREINTYLVTAK